MRTPILIPAFRPGPELVDLIAQLAPTAVPAVVIVDDGSGPEWQHVFDRCSAFAKVQVLRHRINLGKGAALKTGLRYVLQTFPDCAGVVTADADGQHHPGDIVRVAQNLERNPECLVLGWRQFDRRVPVRSRIGNVCTRALSRVVLGQRVQDSQTGLRGLPVKLLPHLTDLQSDGYEFELDMLIASKHLGLRVVEERIQTIYAPGNPGSHFDPLRDSMKIYFVLFRFTALSLGTAVLDNIVFALAIRMGLAAVTAQVAARALAVCVNYPLARRSVFLSKEPHRSTLVRYLTLVAGSGYLSFQLLTYIERFGMGVLDAKILAESALFLLNFVVLRDWVFVGGGQRGATDWDRYYTSPAPTARITRKYTSAVLVDALRRFGGQIGKLVEFGGANSCFLDRIQAQVAPGEYHVVDTNAYGLSLLNGRGVIAHQEDCLEVNLGFEADAVFSIGLIEHFDRAGTRKAVASHFALLKPGGCAIISFPTPTLLYRVARWLTEAVGAWKFPDERPLGREEVLSAASDFGTVEFEKILWPLIYTQRMMVFRKFSR